MRRKFFLLLIVLATLFILVGCPGSRIDELIAKMRFLDYAFAEGEPEGPAAALYLGRVKATDVLQVYTPIKEPSSSDFSDEAIVITPTIGKPGYLFYLDLAPGAFYNHPGRIIVLDEDGEALVDEDVQGWPVLNGVTPQALVSPTKKAYYDAIFWNNSKIRRPEMHITEWIIFQRIVSGAVVVNGLTPTQNLYYEATQIHSLMYNAMVDFMSADTVKQVKYPDNTSSDLEDAVQYLVETKKVNRLTLYFIAHGGYDSMNIGGYSYNASSLKSLIESYPGVKFSIIIESCHAGSWIQAPNNITDPSNVVIAITTTSAALSAYADQDTAYGYSPDYNGPTDVYVEWTSDFLEQMAYYTSAAHWGEVTTLASAESIPSESALYDLCFQRIKGSSPPGTSYTFTERTGIQAPQIYRSY
ncbi:hypothetical protein [Kosmotoga pacifica]|uniref:Uncharacterized protein n=1 Tax=Kosmotoga pacifica TaxID=1330330 RepID=A0A0G2Z6U7_9BACT|nr:hypothetical protein [Kosmotoga pacifica]AKI97330.1 hypothetical protein IX53_05295 [Kosmotoga pacifica]